MRSIFGGYFAYHKAPYSMIIYTFPLEWAVREGVGEIHYTDALEIHRVPIQNKT